MDTYRHTTNVLISAIPLEHDLLLCTDLACSDPTHISAINRLHCNLISALTEADVSLRESKELNHPSQVAGWNELCREAHTDARENFICWLDAGKPKHGFEFEAMRRSRAIFKSSLRQCYKDKDRIKIDAIAKHFLTKETKAFWKEIRKVNNSRVPISDTICGITGESQIAQKWKDHFKSLLNSCSNSGVANFIECDENTTNFSDFKVIEVYNAICKLKQGKSAGLDGLRSEHFVKASSNVSCIVTLLFNACVNHQYLPVEIMNTVIVPIVKDTKADITIQDNYRPIAVTTVLSKLLEMVLLERYSELLVTTSNQFGFKKKHSTEMAVYAFKNVIDHYICNSSPVYVCYMDASKAFDKIDHASLFKKMSNRKIPKAIVNLFVYWYQAQTFYVRWGNCLSEPFHATNGVRQGGILSPYLFNLYIDELSNKLNKANIGCYINSQPVNHLVYADDMVILAPSPRALQQLLNICNEYAIEYDISYNVKKTKCMCVRPKLFKDITVPQILLGGTAIEFVTKYTYLGVEITSSFCDDDDILRQTRAIYAKGNSLIRKFKAASVNVKVQLFKTYICTFYCPALWCYYHKAKFTSFNAAFKRVFRYLFVIRDGSLTAAMLKLNCDPLNTLIRKSVYGFRNRIIFSDNSILSAIVNSQHFHFCSLTSRWNFLLYNLPVG